MSPVSPPPSAPNNTKKSRRLKPEVAAQLAARKREAQLQHLYQQPVEQLSPEEVARMRAAFFRG